jgi:hypothetical protein
MMDMASGIEDTMAAMALVRAVPLFSDTPEYGRGGGGEMLLGREGGKTRYGGGKERGRARQDGISRR